MRDPRHGAGNHPHYIYFVEKANGESLTESVNVTIPSGKTTYNQVTVLIDGKQYILEKEE